MLRRTKLWCLLLIVAVSAPSFGQAVDYRPALKAVVSEMVAKAYPRPTIDEVFCQRWIETYVNSLDPMRLYFLAPDIDEFNTFVKRLPELANSGDPEFHRLVTRRYQERAESALAQGLDQLRATLDFFGDGEIQVRNNGFAASLDDRDVRWRNQLEFELLLEKSNGSTFDEAKSFLRTRYESIREQASELSDERSVGIYLDSFCRSVDPHSGYFTQTESDWFLGAGPFRRFSIGLHIVYKKGRPTIWSIGRRFQDEPAASSLIGCELLAIRAKSGKVHNVREMHWLQVHDLAYQGLGTDDRVTLELYDDVRLHRFSVDWPRK